MTGSSTTGIPYHAKIHHLVEASHNQNVKLYSHLIHINDYTKPLMHTGLHLLECFIDSYWLFPNLNNSSLNTTIFPDKTIDIPAPNIQKQWKPLGCKSDCLIKWEFSVNSNTTAVQTFNCSNNYWLETKYHPMSTSYISNYSPWGAMEGMTSISSLSLSQAHTYACYTFHCHSLSRPSIPHVTHPPMQLAMGYWITNEKLWNVD